MTGERGCFVDHPLFRACFYRNLAGLKSTSGVESIFRAILPYPEGNRRDDTTSHSESSAVALTASFKRLERQSAFKPRDSLKRSYGEVVADAQDGVLTSVDQ